MPKVSVVIPTYNYGQFLAESLDSVLSQDYSDFELIVIDDGSTDKTQAVLDRYAGRLRSVRCHHAGSAAARNVGIGMAEGELIAFHDADDIWLPGSLSCRVRVMEQHPELGMVFGDVTVTKNGHILFPSFLTECKRIHSIGTIKDGGDCFIFTRSVFRDLLHERFVTTPTMLVRRACFDQVGLWDTSVQDQEDYELQIRMAKHFRLGYVDRPLAICRLHGANITYKTRNLNAKRLAIIHRYKNDPDLSSSDRKALRRRLSDLYVESAWYLRTIGDPAAARRHYWLGWVYNRHNCGSLARYLALCTMMRWSLSRKPKPEVAT